MLNGISLHFFMLSCNIPTTERNNSDQKKKKKKNPLTIEVMKGHILGNFIF
jgi:hypothetical protein